MRSCNTFFRAVVFSILSLVAVSQCLATKVAVRAGSDYGSNTSFSDCLSGVSQNACEAFNLTPTIVSFDGQTFDILQFVTGFGNGSPGTVFNIVDLGPVGPNTTFTLPPSFFPAASAEVFSCNDVSNPLTPSSALFDSGQQPITGPCTPDLTTATLDFTIVGSTFTTGADFSTTDLVFDAPATATTPEPASMLLLGAGLLAVGRKFRRR
jgi:hypothetical protein